MEQKPSLKRVSVSHVERMVKDIRLLAKSGRKMFYRFLYQPLEYADWKRVHSNENSFRLLSRIKKISAQGDNPQTIAPLCKRLISVSMTESMSALGDSAIFFLETMISSPRVSYAPESYEFTQIIHPPLFQFMEIFKNQSEDIFQERLKALDREDLKKALSPVELGRANMPVKFQKEAFYLFQKIMVANQSNDIVKCRKLIAAYLINFVDQETNNMEEVEQLILAFEKKDKNFRTELNNVMAIELYYRIFKGITDNKLKNSVQAIGKYTYLFQGNSETLFFYDIDRLEKKLYEIIEKRDLWKELGKS